VHPRARLAVGSAHGDACHGRWTTLGTWSPWWDPARPPCWTAAVGTTTSPGEQRSVRRLGVGTNPPRRARAGRGRVTTGPSRMAARAGCTPSVDAVTGQVRSGDETSRTSATPTASRRSAKRRQARVARNLRDQPWRGGATNATGKGRFALRGARWRWAHLVPGQRVRPQGTLTRGGGVQPGGTPEGQPQTNFALRCAADSAPPTAPTNCVHRRRKNSWGDHPSGKQANRRRGRRSNGSNMDLGFYEGKRGSRGGPGGPTTAVGRSTGRGALRPQVTPNGRSEANDCQCMNYGDGDASNSAQLVSAGYHRSRRSPTASRSRTEKLRIDGESVSHEGQQRHFGHDDRVLRGTNAKDVGGDFTCDRRGPRSSDPRTSTQLQPRNPLHGDDPEPGQVLTGLLENAAEPAEVHLSDRCRRPLLLPAPEGSGKERTIQTAIKVTTGSPATGKKTSPALAGGTLAAKIWYPGPDPVLHLRAPTKRIGAQPRVANAGHRPVTARSSKENWPRLKNAAWGTR